MLNILVIGGTGLQGGAVIDRLRSLRSDISERLSLFTLSRNPDSEAGKKLTSSGVNVIKGDMEDTTSLTNILTSLKIERAFLVTTPYGGVGIEKEIQYGQNFARAATAAGLKHIVFASVEGANRNTGVPHFDSKASIEEAVRDTGISCTILRPVVFMENFPATNDGLGRAIVLGLFAAALGKRGTIQLIAVADVAYFAAESLLSPEQYAGQEIALAGDEVTIPQLAEIYRQIQYGGRSKASVAWIPGFVVNLLPQKTVKMFKFLEEDGSHVNIFELRQQYPGLLSVEGWLRMRKQQGKPDPVIRNW
ncbi:hypothetical protein DL96DRAFT_1536528 [Flagelloscypha sp. PMI_526]|nr:hypothetical protein DL96DRAFT_1536528 [Flagelloscypha sp. PMI_526]